MVNFKKCKEGKEEHPISRRCVKKCEPGVERDSITGNCPKTKKKSHNTSGVKRASKPCKDGKEKHPISGRCVKNCEPGVERDAITGNCVKTRKRIIKKSKIKSRKSPPKRKLDEDTMHVVNGVSEEKAPSPDRPELSENTNSSHHTLESNGTPVVQSSEGNKDKSPQKSPEENIARSNIFGNVYEDDNESDYDDLDDDYQAEKVAPKKKIGNKNKRKVIFVPPSPDEYVPTNKYADYSCPPGLEPSPLNGQCVAVCKDGKVRSLLSGRCVNFSVYRSHQKELIKDHAEELNKKTLGTQPASTKKLDCIDRSDLKLAQYQNEVVRHMENNRGLLVVHGVGSGKTLTAVTLSQCFLDTHPREKVIVSTPKSLLPNFQKEMLKYKKIKHDTQYYFFTHDGLVNFIKYSSYEDAQKFFAKSLLLIDEMHNLRTLPLKKKIGWSRPYYVMEAAKLCSKAVGFTATPVVNSKKDLQNQLSIVTGIDVTLDNSGHTDDLDKYDKYFHVFTRPNEDPAFPSTKSEIIELPMSPKTYEAYLNIKRHLVEKFKLTGTGAYSDMFWISLRQAVNFLDDETSPKAEWTVNLLKNKQKTLIYSTFKNSGVLKIAEKLKENGITFDIINGEKSIKERKNIVNQYNENKIQVLLITKAGGEGLDLKETRQIVLFDPVWNAATEHQIIGRGVRKHSHANLNPKDRNVTIYKLLLQSPDGKTTVDHHLHRIIMRKTKLTDTINSKLSEFKL